MSSPSAAAIPNLTRIFMVETSDRVDWPDQDGLFGPSTFIYSF